MLNLSISNERQRQQLQHHHGPLELGRGPRREVERFVVEDRFVSRDQLRLEELSPGKIRLENLGGPLKLADGTTVETGTRCEMTLPIQFTAGYTTFEISAEFDPLGSSLQTISRPVSMSGRGSQMTIHSLGESPSPARLAEWFETLLTVQQAAAGSNEFYDQTARAIVDLVGLDRGLVLLRRGDDWETAASHMTSTKLGSDFSRRVLAEVLQQQRTFYQGFDDEAWSQSLVGVEAVVASPIFDNRSQVIGIVYGSRSLRAAGRRRGIQPLEAQVVQLLAAAVSAGLARVQREAEAARNRVLFEQFASPELARELERNPTLLEGHQREVSVMFCDVRGYSRIAERLDPRQSYALLSDIMDRLTNRIIDHGGVIIDYYGDGLAAMWNAPADQAHHASEACRAALAMVAETPALNESWIEKIGHPLKIGVGINTGPAQVGNAGSRRRLKYGPRGHVVNLASRVEGATKKFHVPILITSATRSRLPDDFLTRRLCRVHVVGMECPVEIYELCSASDPTWSARRDVYERALTLYESGDWSGAHQELASLLGDAEQHSDLPFQWLTARASANAQDPPEKFDPAFELGSK